MRSERSPTAVPATGSHLSGVNTSASWLVVLNAGGELKGKCGLQGDIPVARRWRGEESSSQGLALAEQRLRDERSVEFSR